MFIIAGLVMGFVISPGVLAMLIWNHFSVANETFPQINVVQGVMLWAMIALTLYMTNNKKGFVSFKSATKLNDKELKDLMERVKLQSQTKAINSMILTSDDLKKIKPKNETEDIIDLKEESHK